MSLNDPRSPSLQAGLNNGNDGGAALQLQQQAPLVWLTAGNATKLIQVRKLSPFSWLRKSKQPTSHDRDEPISATALDAINTFVDYFARHVIGTAALLTSMKDKAVGPASYLRYELLQRAINDALGKKPLFAEGLEATIQIALIQIRSSTPSINYGDARGMVKKALGDGSVTGAVPIARCLEYSAVECREKRIKQLGEGERHLRTCSEVMGTATSAVAEVVLSCTQKNAVAASPTGKATGLKEVNVMMAIYETNDLKQLWAYLNQSGKMALRMEKYLHHCPRLRSVGLLVALPTSAPTSQSSQLEVTNETGSAVVPETIASDSSRTSQTLVGNSAAPSIRSSVVDQVEALDTRKEGEQRQNESRTEHTPLTRIAVAPAERFDLNKYIAQRETNKQRRGSDFSL
ncbi:hypothetical protein GQ42DRAFT_163609, partial [Ramicandelaber brevisporus]